MSSAPAKAIKSPENRQRKGQPKPTKIDRMLALLFSGARLNTFEAGRIGDSCLNSTISTLYRGYGLEFDREWEEVPNNFGGVTRVKVYRLADSSKERAARILKRKGVRV